MTTGRHDTSQSASLDQGGQEGRETEQRHLVANVGPLEVDAPKAAGYYAGLAAALALGLIEPPLAVFIAVAPLFKLLTRPDASRSEWAIGQILQGASTPVGGGASPVIRISTRSLPVSGQPLTARLVGPLGSIWTDARQLAEDGKR